MPKRDPRGGSGRNQGRKRTDIRNLVATPPELMFDEPVTATADVTIWWCPDCGATWWEQSEAHYYDADASLVASATIPEQAEHHIKGCKAKESPVA